MFRPHHLELFYYVARYGGISAAVRHIPYGIGQPAVSGQMADLEREVGARLFHRRPFQLTEQGRRIYDHVRPFHDRLGELWHQVRAQPAQTLRLAAAGTLGPEVLTSLIDAAAPLPAGIRCELLTGPSAALETWVQERSVQLAITTADGRISRVCSRVIARPGLRLLVPRQASISSAGYFWRQKQIAESLISPPETDPLGRCFARGLQALHVEWNAGLWVESSAMLAQLVAGGHGVGVGLNLPWSLPPRAVRALPLPGFAPVPLLVLWRKPVGPLLESLLAAVDTMSKKFWPTRSGLAPLFVGPWLMFWEEWGGALSFL